MLSSANNYRFRTGELLIEVDQYQFHQSDTGLRIVHHRVDDTEGWDLTIEPLVSSSTGSETGIGNAIGYDFETDTEKCLHVMQGASCENI